MQTLQVSKQVFTTSNTKQAAALLTLGVAFADQSQPVTNVYDEKRPYRDGTPGKVTYILASESSSRHSASELAAAFDAMTADQELDALIEGLCNDKTARVRETGERLRDLLPLALMSYLRAGLENRERILDLWRRALPMVYIRRGENSFTLVSRNASQATLRHLGLE